MSEKGSGSVMGAIGSESGFFGNLPQLKKIYRLSFGHIRHSLSAVAVFAGIVVPAFLVFFADRAESSVDIVASVPKSTSMATDELCRWKKDVAFFSAIESGRKSSPDEISCDVPKEKDASVDTHENEPADAVADDELIGMIREVAAGYPIEAMAGTIAGYDKEVAALIVGIAKKESNWGKHVPLDADGKDCFNYWGWKGAGARGTAMGHGCFGTPEEAVKAVGDRLTELVKLRQTSEPKNLTVWKCGSSCATHNPESVRKWVSDVDMYYRKIAKN
jgi:hypothetical protein